MPWVHLLVPLQGVTSWGLTPLPSTVNTLPRKNASKNLELPQHASSSNCTNREESSLTTSILYVVIGVQATRPSVWTWPEWWTTTSSFVENLASTTLKVRNLQTKKLLSLQHASSSSSLSFSLLQTYIFFRKYASQTSWKFLQLCARVFSPPSGIHNNESV